MFLAEDEAAVAYSDYREFPWQETALFQVKQRRQQLSLCKITRAAEDHNYRGVRYLALRLGEQLSSFLGDHFNVALAHNAFLYFINRSPETKAS